MSDERDIDEELKNKMEQMSLEEVAEKSASVDGMSEEAISHLLSDNTADSMKAFLVVLAQRELKRVVKLVDSLGDMEDALMDIVQDRREMEQLEPGQLAYLIRTLHKSLERSMELINKIVEEENYYQFIIDNSQVNNVNNLPNKLDSPDARERVRDIFEQIADDIDPNDMDKTKEAIETSEVVEKVED